MTAGDHIDTQAFNMTYGGAIAGSGGFVKSGAGSLTLTNNGNTFAGGVAVLGGTLIIASDAQLGAVPAAPTPMMILLNGATLQTSASFTLAANRGISVGPGDGTIFLSGLNNVTYAGVIAGGGNLVKTGSGTLFLRGSSNTFTGSTSIPSGTLNITSDAQLGGVPGAPTAGKIALLSGGTLQAAADMTISANRGMTISSLGGTIDTQNFNVTYAGAIVGGTSLFKSGGGTLTLGINNGAYTGPITINAGTLFAGAASSLGDAFAPGGNNHAILNGGNLQATGAINDPLYSMVVLLNGTVNTGGFDSTFGDVSGGTSGNFTKTGAGNLAVIQVRLGASLAVNAGKLTIAPNGLAGGSSAVNALSIAAAQLDITNNHLVDHSTGVGTWDGSNYSGLTALIRSGRGSGAWNGNGIITSLTDATTSNFTSIGVATASEAKGVPFSSTATAVWAGQTVTGTDTLVMYTYGGDSNLDGKINVDDYGRIDFAVPLGLSGWSNGDFNYDGKINVDDYGIIDFNVGIQGAPFFSASEPLAGVANQSTSAVAVPEPASPILVPLSAVLLFRPHRRRRKN